MRRRLTALIATAGALLLSVCGGSAFADYGLKEFELGFFEADETPALQAGSHPHQLTTTLQVNTTTVPEGPFCLSPSCEVPDGETRDLFVKLPPGFVGNPFATPRCSPEDFGDLNSDLSIPSCPDSSAVGMVGVKAEFTPFPSGEEAFFYAPLYNLVPPPGVAAKLGFVILGVPVTLESGVEEGQPYRLETRVTGVSQALLFYGSKLILWGNPADPVHDPLRGSCLDAKAFGEIVSLGNCAVGLPEVPFITLPRSCQGPLSTEYRSAPWHAPNAFVAGQATAAGMVGCGRLGFGPEIDAKPTTASAESPAGLNFTLSVKDEGIVSPTGLAQSDIRRIVTTLPEGVTVNPSAAEGLGVCTKAQFEAGSLTHRGCPEAAKLGRLEVETPVLENRTLEGVLYLAQQDDPSTSEPKAENPFDSLIALYLEIRDPELGIFIKQAGKVEPDPRTGQLVTTFDELPQFPLSRVTLRFREGPRAPLVTPPACGTYTTEARFTPWAGGAPVTAASQFKVTSGVGGGSCPAAGPRPFAPGFTAGTISNAAGSYSPFFMRLTRADGEQDMTRFDSILPPGVVGKIAGVERCPEAGIAAAGAKSGREELALPSCPAGSQIGTVLAGAGVGPALTYVPGKIYLSGPYAGDPLSVVVITPAVAGPFDAGTVVVREALRLNPVTAEVEVDGAASDPIPHILKGIPLKLRDLRVHIDRERFILNPTGCREQATRATLFGSFTDVFGSADDVPVALSSRFQAADCAALPYKPKLKISLKGGTKRNAYPALEAVLTPRPGDANTGKAVVTLPRSAFLEQSHIRTICTRVQFAAKTCPPGSVYGRAIAYTPLLDEPLSGPVYLRSSDNPLPDLVAALHGTVDINLVGRIDSVNARIRSSFESPPDAPVSKFVLKMQGGKKGLIVNSTNLCKGRKKRAKVRLTGHNDRVRAFKPVVRVNGCKSGSKGKRVSAGRHKRSG